MRPVVALVCWLPALAGCGEQAKPASGVGGSGSLPTTEGGGAGPQASAGSPAGGSASASSAGGGGGSSSAGSAGTSAGGGVGGAPVVQGSLVFTRKDLHRFNYAEGIGIGDFNGDGQADVHSGPFWWAGPDFAAQHQLFPPPPDNSYTGMSLGDWANYEFDVDADGWLDSINIMRPSTPSYWYKNPGQPAVEQPVSTWVKSELGTLVLEQSGFWDIAGGGVPSLVCAIDGKLGFFDPSPSSPWVFHEIGPAGATLAYAWWHGIGVGDLDGDANRDLLTDSGWFTRPAAGARAGAWTKHAQRFKGDDVIEQHGPSHMYGYDVDADGDEDVITALDSHGYGIAWYENDGGTFTPHVIVGGEGSTATNAGGIAPFSQPHAMVVADIDGDGTSDLVAGKTFYAHPPGMGDPDADGTPVFYVFKLVRGAAGPSWEPHLVDSEVGLGRQFATGDLNGDGKVDIAVASKHGAFLFFQQ